MLLYNGCLLALYTQAPWKWLVFPSKNKILPGLYVLKYHKNISLFLTDFTSKETTAVVSWEAESSTMNGMRSDLCRNSASTSVGELARFYPLYQLNNG